VALSVELFGPALLQHLSPAAVPPPLASATATAAVAYAAGGAAAGVVSPQVLTLSEGILKAMLLTKVKLVAASLLAVGILAVFTGGLAYRALADKPSEIEGQPSEVQVQAVAAPARQAATGKFLEVGKTYFFGHGDGPPQSTVGTVKELAVGPQGWWVRVEIPEGKQRHTGWVNLTTTTHIVLVPERVDQ
jgi:hypothetical protein